MCDSKQIQDIADKLDRSNRKIMRTYLTAITAVLMAFFGFILQNTIELNTNIARLMESKAEKKTTLTINSYKKAEIAQLRYFYSQKLDALKPDDVDCLSEILEQLD